MIVGGTGSLCRDAKEISGNHHIIKGLFILIDANLNAAQEGSYWEMQNMDAIRHWCIGKGRC